MSAWRSLLVLLAIVAWLTAAGTAVRSVSRIWLRHWVERRLRGSESAALYLERPQRLLLVAGAGVALCVFVAGMLLAVDARGWWGRATANVVVAALAVLLFGQLVPRALARRWAPGLVPVLLPVLRLLGVVLAPVLVVARAVARRLSREPERTHDEEVRDDIEELLREGELEGVGQGDEIAIITGVVHFGEKTVAEVMTPRAEVFALDAALPADEMARRIAQAGYSRVPLYRGTLDDVVGMTHAFDVLKATGDEPPPLLPVARAVAERHCNELLFELLRKRLHLAVVSDVTGRTVGVVTLEDLLEELVGDIRDEHDEPAGALPAGLAPPANPSHPSDQLAAPDARPQPEARA
jgi:putative hemolysin